jgi:hypothetical protein
MEPVRDHTADNQPPGKELATAFLRTFPHSVQDLRAKLSAIYSAQLPDKVEAGGAAVQIAPRWHTAGWERAANMPRFGNQPSPFWLIAIFCEVMGYVFQVFVMDPSPRGRHIDFHHNS